MAKSVFLSLIYKLVERYENDLLDKPTAWAERTLGQGKASDIVQAAILLGLLTHSDPAGERNRDIVRRKLKQYWEDENFNALKAIVTVLTHGAHSPDFDIAKTVIGLAGIKITIDDSQRSEVDKTFVTYRDLLKESDPPRPVGNQTNMTDPLEIRLTPRHFEGHASGETIVAWLRAYDDVAKSNRWGDEKKIELLPIFLLGEANVFFRKEASLPGGPTTWNQWKDRLTKRFLAPEFEEQIRTKFYSTTQKPDESPVRFFDTMIELAFQADQNMSDQEKLRVIKRAIAPKFLRLCGSVPKNDLESFREALVQAEETSNLCDLSNKRDKDQKEHKSQMAALQKQINELKVQNQPTSDKRKFYKNEGPSASSNNRGRGRGRGPYQNSPDTHLNYNNHNRVGFSSSFRGFSRGYSRGQSRGRGRGNFRGRGGYRGGAGWNKYYQPWPVNQLQLIAPQGGQGALPIEYLYDAKGNPRAALPRIAGPHQNQFFPQNSNDQKNC